MRRITRGIARLSFCLILLLLCQWASSAPPAENHFASHIMRRQRSENESWNWLSYLATKAVAAFVRAASFVYQWIPGLPSFMMPAKPTLRFAKRSSWKNNNGFNAEDFE